MEIFIRPLFFLSLFFVHSCSKKLEIIEFGKTKYSTLVQMKGEPKKSTPTPKNSSLIHTFSNNEKYQTKNDIVIAGFRDPLEHEKTILFWRDKFKNCKTTERKVNDQETELSCKELGQSVLFQDGFEFIHRVVEYEKK